jgi:hypothetical protein
LNILQKISMSLMGVLVLITFIGANLHALLWQSSDWLVSTVLPSIVVQLTNEERFDNSTIPLQRNSTLDKAAKLKAEHMAENEYFSHFSPKGVSPWYWFDESGYVYAHAGENLAIHFTDSSEVVEAWMKSPTHRENIVNGVYTEIGVGTAKGKFEGYDTVYVVQLFGTPALALAPAKVTEEPIVLSTESVPLTVAAPSPEVESKLAINFADLDTSPVEFLDTKAIPETLSESVPEIISEEKPSELPVVTPQPDVKLVDTKDIVDVSSPDDLILSEVVIIESPVISTSSGLAVAQIANTPSSHAGATVPAFVTQPNMLLQIIYSVLAVVVVALLSLSVVQEARRFHFQQVAYGIMLLVGMGGLWFAHSVLTTGAVII